MQDQIRSAAARAAPLRLRGGGSKDFYGNPPRGELLDTRGYAGIVDYEPTELVITARCGTPLAQIEAALAERKQMLAFEPPHFGEDATLGGAIAAGLSGPRRANSGALSLPLSGCRCSRVTRSTLSAEPRISGTRWCSDVAVRSRIRWRPVVAPPPACSIRNAIGCAS